jgi:hypothetical protein
MAAVSRPWALISRRTSTRPRPAGSSSISKRVVRESSFLRIWAARVATVSGAPRRAAACVAAAWVVGAAEPVVESAAACVGWGSGAASAAAWEGAGSMSSAAPFAAAWADFWALPACSAGAAAMETPGSPEAVSSVPSPSSAGWVVVFVVVVVLPAGRAGVA